MSLVKVEGTFWRDYGFSRAIRLLPLFWKDIKYIATRASPESEHSAQEKLYSAGTLGQLDPKTQVSSVKHLGFFPQK